MKPMADNRIMPATPVELELEIHDPAIEDLVDRMLINYEAQGRAAQVDSES